MAIQQNQNFALARVSQCTASMRVGLVGYWKFHTAGATTILAGAPAGQTATLILNRSSRTTGAPLSASAGWTTETPGGVPTYNGCGTVAGFAGLTLAQDGDAVTIAARCWLKGGDIQGGSGPLSGPIQLVGLGGQYSPSGESGISLIVPDPSLALNVPSTATLAVRQWTGSSAFQFALFGARAFLEPSLYLLTVERSGDFILCSVWVNGEAAGLTIAAAAPLIDLTRITFGDAVFSDGAVSSGGVWNRKLLAAEIQGLATTLNCVHGVQAEPPPPPTPEEFPLLNNDGTSAVHPEWIVPRDHAHGAIASAGGGRHTRLTHERRRKRYGLRIRLGNGGEALVLARVLVTTAGGARWTRWRHPTDDPAGTPETAPRYRIVNAAEGAMALTRTGGGAIGDFTLVLEEV